MAGAWLRFRGHLENISDNMLMGAVNAFNGKTNCVWNRLTGGYEAVSAVAKQYKAAGIPSIVVAEENYGEGSSREHAAMEPALPEMWGPPPPKLSAHPTNPPSKEGRVASSFYKTNPHKNRKQATPPHLPSEKNPLGPVRPPLTVLKKVGNH